MYPEGMIALQFLVLDNGQHLELVTITESGGQFPKNLILPHQITF